jgi:hypothetical protein
LASKALLEKVRKSAQKLVAHLGKVRKTAQKFERLLHLS